MLLMMIIERTIKRKHATPPSRAGSLSNISLWSITDLIIIIPQEIMKNSNILERKLIDRQILSLHILFSCCSCLLWEDVVSIVEEKQRER